MIEHCVLAFDSSTKEKIYRGYIADGLMCLSESIANTYGGSYLQRRYTDIIEGVVEEEVSADDIVLGIMERAELRVKGE